MLKQGTWEWACALSKNGRKVRRPKWRPGISVLIVEGDYSNSTIMNIFEENELTSTDHCYPAWGDQSSDDWQAYPPTFNLGDL